LSINRIAKPVVNALSDIAKLSCLVGGDAAGVAAVFDPRITL
jgi:hypothetical protein